jgi:hypothetical protein
MDPNIIIPAMFALVGVVYSAQASKAAKAVHTEVVTNHGKRQGQRVEELGDSVRSLGESVLDLRTDLRAHIEDERERSKMLATLIGLSHEKRGSNVL